MYVVESKGQKMAVLGDLMHVAAVQFVNPSVTIEFDTDPKQAAVQRRKVSLWAIAVRGAVAHDGWMRAGAPAERARRLRVAVDPGDVHLTPPSGRRWPPSAAVATVASDRVGGQ